MVLEVVPHPVSVMVPPLSFAICPTPPGYPQTVAPSSTNGTSRQTYSWEFDDCHGFLDINDDSSAKLAAIRISPVFALIAQHRTTPTETAAP